MQQISELFFTSIGCMDGRIQDIVAKYGIERFGVSYADTITEAGLVGILAQHASDKEFMEGFCKKLFISISEHQSKGVIVHAHENCAGNPVSSDQQKEQVRGAVELISSLVAPTPVIGIYVYRDATQQAGWSIEEI